MAIKSKKGKFIVIEGGEGSGKTSVINYIKIKFPKFLFTHEPGGTLIGKKIRDILLSEKFKPDVLTELFLFCADRAEHINKVILPALNKNVNVVCDRFDYSTFAYQIFGRQRFNLMKTFKILDKIAKDNIEPDLVIYLDVNPKIGLARKEKQKTELTKFEKEKIDFHNRVRKGFLTQFKEKKYLTHSLKTKFFIIYTNHKNLHQVREEIFNILKTSIKN